MCQQRFNSLVIVMFFREFQVAYDNFPDYWLSQENSIIELVLDSMERWENPAPASMPKCDFFAPFSKKKNEKTDPLGSSVRTLKNGPTYKFCPNSGCWNLQISMNRREISKLRAGPGAFGALLEDLFSSSFRSKVISALIFTEGFEPFWGFLKNSTGSLLWDAPTFLWNHPDTVC